MPDPERLFLLGMSRQWNSGFIFFLLAFWAARECIAMLLGPLIKLASPIENEESQPLEQWHR